MSNQPEFLWGAATSSHQIEGNNIYNDWWAWEQLGKVENKEFSGRSTDHWNLFKEDLNLAHELGLNAYRFSIEWSRIEPSEGNWDLRAMEWYRELVFECERLQLKPMVTLHHFTSPLWFTEKGGFLQSNSTEKFLNYVDKVVSVIGERVPLWCTFNEPMVLAVGQYLGSFMPPGEFQPEKVSQVSYQLLKSHVRTYDLIHRKVKNRKGPWAREPLQVGIANNMVDFFPSRRWHPIERILSLFCHRFFNLSWLEAITGQKQNFGVPWLIPSVPQVNEALGRLTCDYLGINYYTKGYLNWRPARDFEADFPVQVKFSKTTEEKSDLDWAIHPTGIGKMIRQAKSYGLPIYITENGIADRMDRQRGKYIVQHLIEIAREIEQGASVQGYFYWSLLDNFEWIKGYGPRFGLIEVDYSTLNRIVRPSARMFSELVSMHRAYFKRPHLPILKGFLSQNRSGVRLVQ